MFIKSRGLGLGGVVVIAALIGCGSSGSSSGGTGGSAGGATGKGGGSANGGSTGSGGTFTTGVPSSTPLTSLTTAQGTQLCNDFNSWATTVLAKDLCKSSGFIGALVSGATSDAAIQAACTSAYNSCLSADGGSPTTNCTASALMTQPATCTATVGDVTGCLNATSAVYDQIPSCNTLTAASLAATAASDAGTSPEPASCMAVDTCPGVGSPSQ